MLMARVRLVCVGAFGRAWKPDSPEPVLLVPRVPDFHKPILRSMKNTPNTLILLFGPGHTHIIEQFGRIAENVLLPSPESRLETILARTIKELYEKGHRTFFSDLQSGFNLEAANCVLMLRENDPELKDIRLLVNPPDEQTVSGYDNLSRALYADILDNARNHYRDAMDICQSGHCSHLLCYNDGIDEPTRAMILQAQKNDIPVIDLREA